MTAEVSFSEVNMKRGERGVGYLLYSECSLALQMIRRFQVGSASNACRSKKEKPTSELRQDVPQISLLIFILHKLCTISSDPMPPLEYVQLDIQRIHGLRSSWDGDDRRPKPPQTRRRCLLGRRCLSKPSCSQQIKDVSDVFHADTNMKRFEIVANFAMGHLLQCRGRDERGR